MALRIVYRHWPYAFLAICIAVSNLLANAARADDTHILKDLTGSVEWSDQYNPILKLSDGREARLVSFDYPQTKINMRLDVTENACDVPHGIPECSLAFIPKIQMLAIIWSKHSDATKVGKVVQVRYEQSSSGNVKTYGEPQDFYKQIDIGMEDILYRGGTSPDDSEKTRLVCKSKDYFDHLTSDDGNFILANISSEFNLPNSETRVNENRSFGSAENLIFKKEESGNYRLETIQTLSAQFFSPFLGQTLYWALRIPKGSETCDVQFSSDISEFTRVQNAAGKMQLNPASMKNLTWATSLSMQMNLKSWMGKIDGKLFE